MLQVQAAVATSAQSSTCSRRCVARVVCTPTQASILYTRRKRAEVREPRGGGTGVVPHLFLQRGTERKMGWCLKPNQSLKVGHWNVIHPDLVRRDPPPPRVASRARDRNRVWDKTLPGAVLWCDAVLLTYAVQRFFRLRDPQNSSPLAQTPDSHSATRCKGVQVGWLHSNQSTKRGPCFSLMLQCHIPEMRWRRRVIHTLFNGRPCFQLHRRSDLGVDLRPGVTGRQQGLSLTLSSRPCN